MKRNIESSQNLQHNSKCKVDFVELIIKSLDELKIKAKVTQESETNLHNVVDFYFHNRYQYQKFQKNTDTFLSLLKTKQANLTNVSANNQVKLAVPKPHLADLKLSNLADHKSSDKQAKNEIPLIMGLYEKNKLIFHDLQKRNLQIITNNFFESDKVLDSLVTQLLHIQSKEDVKFAFLGSENKKMNRFAQLIEERVFLPWYNIMLGHGIRKADLFFDLLFDEIDHRNELLLKTHSRNLEDLYTRISKKVPHVIVFIDDYLKLIEKHRNNLARKLSELEIYGKFVGIHIVLISSLTKEVEVPYLISSSFLWQLIFNNEYLSSFFKKDFKKERQIINLCRKGDALYIFPQNSDKWNSNRIQFAFD